MDKLRRMEIFTAIVEAGQLTQAANTLNISKSAVSHALTDLEKYLDIPLIKRNNRTWQLTDVGSTYYAQCKKILLDVQAMEDISQQDNPTLSGLIRISAPDTFGSYTLTPIIAKFMDMHPNIIVDINLTERYVDIIEERVHLAFRTGNGSDNKSQFSVQVIGKAAMAVYASPKYLEKNGYPENHRQLKNHKCIRYTRSPMWKFNHDGRAYEFTPQPYIMTDSGENLREFCIRGQGLAYMPSSLADFAAKKGRLKRVLTHYQFSRMSIKAIMVRDNRAPTRVGKLLEYIVSELQSREHDVAEFV